MKIETKFGVGDKVLYKEKLYKIVGINIYSSSTYSYIIREANNTDGFDRNANETELKSYEEPILTDKEKEYLGHIIKPFRDKVDYIIKIQSKFDSNDAFIKIGLHGIVSEEIDFPYFDKNEMYNGMEINKRYFLDELGL